MSNSFEHSFMLQTLCLFCDKSYCLLAGRPVGQVTFMVDFFEHCQLSNDIEFGGNDVLQVYNTAQVKHRLNTTGMYIASTKVLLFIVNHHVTSVFEYFCVRLQYRKK